MVQRQLRDRGIRDPRVLEVMEQTPREAFVGPAHRHEAYADHPLPIGQGQTISQPYIVALMTQELEVRPRDRVLEIGCGCGYQTAILAALAGHVYAVERIEALTERAISILGELSINNVTVKTDDGTLGWAEFAPYDRILCAAAGPQIPKAWIDQLDDGGRLVMPVGGMGAQSLIAADKEAGRLRERELCDVRFVPLVGQESREPGS
jgi:protein-L-isoaspartate(D-aspartate) O-methyltransferase